MGVAADIDASDKVAFASSFAMFASSKSYEQIRNLIAEFKQTHDDIAIEIYETLHVKKTKINEDIESK